MRIGLQCCQTKCKEMSDTFLQMNYLCPESPVICGVIFGISFSLKIPHPFHRIIRQNESGLFLYRYLTITNVSTAMYRPFWSFYPIKGSIYNSNEKNVKFYFQGTPEHKVLKLDVCRQFLGDHHSHSKIASYLNE